MVESACGTDRMVALSAKLSAQDERRNMYTLFMSDRPRLWLGDRGTPTALGGLKII
jgi:hypothetical protein